jgi:methyl-accepting chemotaxis protein
MGDNLLTPSEFRSRYMKSSGLLSLVSTGMITAYLVALLRLSPEQWAGFGGVVAVLFPIFFASVQIVQRKTTKEIVEYLEAEQKGESSQQQRERAFASITRLPLTNFYSGLGWWTAAGVFVTAGMWISFGTIQIHTLLMIIFAGASGGFLVAVYQFFHYKELYRDVREHLSTQLGTSAEREHLVTRVSLRQKLMVSIVGVSLVTVIFAMLLAVAYAGRPLESNTTRSQQAYLQELAEQATGGVVHDLEGAASLARRLYLASDLLLVDASSGAIAWGAQDVLAKDELAAVLAGGDGVSDQIDSTNAFSWARVPESTMVVVAVTPWSEVRGDVGVTGSFFVGAVLVAGLIAFALATLLANDITQRTRDLRRAAEQVSAGDLRPMLLVEAEDELGSLGRAFEGMADSLRATVGQVAGAADFVDTKASEIATISSTIATGAGEQSSGVREAVESMDRMSTEVGGISTAAQELNMLVEESSSSILEMGAAGDELNDTAGVLSSRVEEVSSSIEQMVRSVKEVSTHTSSLSDAATDTSASMEEMASAMRQVDTIAQEASDLSRDVVDAADGGRAKVMETVDGMESIRSATATAEQVIMGLGSRAKEIGSILDVIDDVADETNLLALNAAIIAAQAGDHGRAFSVVADEIKELADRVLASTKEIGDQIRAVQEESENAVGAIAEGSRSVAVGVDRSREAGEALDEITRASRESGDRIHEIVRSVQEQSKAATHVVEMMEKVNIGVEAIHRATGEQDRGNEIVFRSTVAMREVAQQLRATTEEQSRGGARIRQSIDGVREAVEAINTALQSQSSSCQEVVGFLEEVSAGSQANDVSSHRLAEATQVLLTQAESLRQDVQNFVLSEAAES